MRLPPVVQQGLDPLLREIATAIYPDAQGYRTSILGRDRDEDLVFPLLRWQGACSAPVDRPGVGLPRGVPVAGQAWAEPGQCFILELPIFRGREELIRFYQDELGVLSELARLLGPQMTDVRSILCVGLHLDPSDEPIILSVDCFAPIGFVESRPGGFVLRKGGAFQTCLMRFRNLLAQEAYCGQPR